MTGFCMMGTLVVKELKSKKGYDGQGWGKGIYLPVHKLIGTH